MIASSTSSNSKQKKSGRGWLFWLVKLPLALLGILIASLILVFIIDDAIIRSRLFTRTPEGAFASIAMHDVNILPYTWLGYASVPFRGFGQMRNLDNSKRQDDKWIRGMDRRYGHLAEYWEMRPTTAGMSRFACYSKSIEINPNVPDVMYLKFKSELDEKSRAWKEGNEWNPEWDELPLDGLREAEKLEPANGAWNFLAACELNNLGEWEEAKNELRKALAKPQFRMPRLYPLREYVRLSSHLINSGALLMPVMNPIESWDTDEMNYRMLRDAYKKVAAGFHLGGDVEALTLWHKSAVKYSTEYPFDQMEKMSSPLLIDLLAKSYISACVDQNSDDAAAAKEMLLRTEYYRKSLTAMNTAFSFSPLFALNLMPVTGYDEDAPNIDAFENSGVMTQLQLTYNMISSGKGKLAIDYAAHNARNELAEMFLAPLYDWDYADPAESLKRLKISEIPEWQVGNEIED